ncbi:hypothetical protein R50073_45580 [Maricurvus nonylphenolicus]|uniref:DUF6210 family protein n=1 Tax=Maricurvus nonylphenolicus TaxID=1008307 RepID=UPI0036F386C3
MQKLCLYNLEQAGLILLLPTGISLFNWTGGIDCLTQEAEGAFVPLSNDPMPDATREEYLDAQLGELCKPQQDKAQQTITPTLANDIDYVLQQVSSSDVIRVDRSRLAESSAGWIYVLAEGQGDFSQLQGFTDEVKAVLTWPNRYNS